MPSMKCIEQNTKINCTEQNSCYNLANFYYCILNIIEVVTYICKAAFRLLSVCPKKIASKARN